MSEKEMVELENKMNILAEGKRIELLKKELDREINILSLSNVYSSGTLDGMGYDYKRHLLRVKELYQELYGAGKTGKEEEEH